MSKPLTRLISRLGLQSNAGSANRLRTHALGHPDSQATKLGPAGITATWPQQTFSTSTALSRPERTSGARFERAIDEAKEKQIRTPWHHEGSDTPPVRRERSAGAMTKGKLLTTPSRLLKLILPLTTLDKNSDRKDIEPLALMVHPQQPLSYLERLIQSELPSIEDKHGQQKIPSVNFWAEDSGENSLTPPKERGDEGEHDENLEHTKIDGEIQKTGKLGRASGLRGGPGEGGVESYSGLGHEAPERALHDKHFIRWSTSTEIGDFIKDAARGQQFAVEIEGAPEPILVGVPSFNDRTYYLRSRLRKLSTQIAAMAEVKRECDIAAHKGAQRVAMGGFGLLAGWWYVVYRLTFETELGWDTMEPITYLVGLITVMGGYLWFLWHNREVSYRSALNLTVSRRQNKLYQAKGFDLHKWETLVDEANALRREIIQIAREYDVEWDEEADEIDSKVTKALKEQRRGSKADDEGSKRKKTPEKDDDLDD